MQWARWGDATPNYIILANLYLGADRGSRCSKTRLLFNRENSGENWCSFDFDLLKIGHVVFGAIYSPCASGHILIEIRNKSVLAFVWETRYEVRAVPVSSVCKLNLDMFIFLDKDLDLQQVTYKVVWCNGST